MLYTFDDSLGSHDSYPEYPIYPGYPDSDKRIEYILNIERNYKMKKIWIVILLLIMAPVLCGWSADVFCRYEYKGEIHYGQVKDGVIHELSKAPWDGGKETGETIGKDDVRLLHPSVPQKIIGMAGTYKEAWADGAEPYNTVRWFLKPPTAAAAPNEDIVLPAALDELMVETELLIVIGKRIKNAGLEEAKDAIFGYSIANDIVGSVSSYHRVNGEPFDQKETLLAPALKQGDGFNPFGPFIYRGVDWRDRERTLIVTNEKTGKRLVYTHNTSNMIYTPEKIVSDLSCVFSLNPGDIICTGTTEALPARAGDRMEVRVEGLGVIVNHVVAE